MRRITLYILRSMVVTFVAATAVLVFAAWLTQSLRLVEVMVESAAPFDVFGLILGSTLPHLLALVLPFGLAGAVLFTYGRLIGDSELIVMRAAGLSPLQLARPAAALSVVATLMVYGLTLYLVPVATRQSLDLRELVRTEYAMLLVHEGRFNTLGGNLTVYFRERRDNGELHGLLVQDNSDPARPVTMVADRGLLTAQGGAPRVVLLGGMRQEADRTGHTLDTLHFDQYTVDLSFFRPEIDTGWLPPRARFVGQLLRPDPQEPRDVERYNELVTLGHENLSWPLLPIGYAFIALGVLLSGDVNRRGQRVRVAAAVLGIIGLQAAALIAANLTRGEIALFPLMYLTPLLAALAGLAMLLRRPHRPRMARLAPA